MRQISDVKQQQEKAHQLAELVRSLGEEETHHAIQFAKEKWIEQQEVLDELYQQYEDSVEEERLYIGTFCITHYCPCPKCNGPYTVTASGTAITPWYTIAVDTNVIPLGSNVCIDGYGEFEAQDTGGRIRGNRIDVCVGSHDEAKQLGVVYKDVYIRRD